MHCGSVCLQRLRARLMLNSWLKSSLDGSVVAANIQNCFVSERDEICSNSRNGWERGDHASLSGALRSHVTKLRRPSPPAGPPTLTFGHRDFAILMNKASVRHDQKTGVKNKSKCSQMRSGIRLIKKNYAMIDHILGY